MTGMLTPLVVSGLNKRYGKLPVLRDLNLEVAPGAIHGLVGLNGSGKTTTLECILGMQHFDGGSVQVLGRQPARLHEAHGAVVSIFDSPSLNPGLTVRQALEHARILCPTPVRSPDEVESLLGISRYSRFKIRNLSLGNRRRASIAQALIGQPAFVILDEPFNGLDAGGVDDVLALISRLNQQEGTAFLLSSHQLPYLESICSHLAILHRGQIVLSDRVETLFSARQTQLTIRCDQRERAVQVLEDLPGVTVASAIANGNAGHGTTDSVDITVRPGTVASSEINRLLTGAGVAVSELIMERPSLTSLFHEITSSDAQSAPPAGVMRGAA